MIKALLGILLVFAAPPAFAGAASGGPLSVAASIEPVQSLVEGVMGKAGTPALLIPAGQSPHTFEARPSTALAIARADVVFRIAPGFEIALDGPLAIPSARREVVNLIDAKGVTLYPARDPDDAVAAGALAGPARSLREELSRDPHIWLDPDNARAMVAAIAQVLAKRDPAQAEIYRGNEEKVEQRLAALDVAIKAQLAPVRSRRFIVFHDGYQYLERHYGLAFAGAVTEMPGLPPGARHLHLIREEIASAHVRCVFSEPEFQPSLLATLAEGLPVKLGVLDPMGVNLPPGPDQYFDMMRALSGALAGCLA